MGFFARRVIAVAALVVSLPAAAVFSLAVYIIQMEGSCPSNQCDDDRVILLMSSIIVPAAILASYLAIRVFRSSVGRPQTQKGPPSRS